MNRSRDRIETDPSGVGAAAGLISPGGGIGPGRRPVHRALSQSARVGDVRRAHHGRAEITDADLDARMMPGPGPRRLSAAAGGCAGAEVPSVGSADAGEHYLLPEAIKELRCSAEADRSDLLQEERTEATP
jgi:hypothetical protein